MSDPRGKMGDMKHARVTYIDHGERRDVMKVYFSGVRGWGHRWCEVVDPATHEDTFQEGDIWDWETRTLIRRASPSRCRA